jgi:hypothetical protein
MTRTPKRELNSCRPRTTLIRGLTTDRLQPLSASHQGTLSHFRFQGSEKNGAARLGKRAVVNVRRG